MTIIYIALGLLAAIVVGWLLLWSWIGSKWLEKHSND
jgi:hypothetical protein